MVKHCSCYKTKNETELLWTGIKTRLITVKRLLANKNKMGYIKTTADI
jgi:hypothetical protein